MTQNDHLNVSYMFPMLETPLTMPIAAARFLKRYHLPLDAQRVDCITNAGGREMVFATHTRVTPWPEHRRMSMT